MLKLCKVTKVKVLFLVLVYVFNLNVFEFRPPFWRRVYYGLICSDTLAENVSRKKFKEIYDLLLAL